MMNYSPTAEPTTHTDSEQTATANGHREPMESATARRKRFRQQLIERQKGKGIRLSAFLLELRQRYRQLDREARLKHLRDIDLMFRYYNGDQYGEHDGAGVWQTYGLQDGDYAYTIPVISGHVDQAFMQLLKTQIEYTLAPNDKANVNQQGLARMCEELALEDLRRLWTEDAVQLEAINTLLAGESYRYLFWAPDTDQPKQTRRLKYREEEVEIPGRRECQACGQEVTAGAQACACGATFFKEVAPASMTKTFPAGHEEVPLGENQLHIPHVMAVQRDLSSAGFKLSPFIIERDYLYQHVAEWAYQTKIQTGDGELSEEARTRRELERSSMQTDAVAGSARQPHQWMHDGGTAARQIERERLWLDASEYGHFYCDQEETLPDGTVIPLGTLLGDHFPDGLFFCVMGRTITEVKAAKKNRKWSVVLYGLRPGTGRGVGMQSLIPLQDIVNDTFNLDYAVMMTHARPLTAVARQSVKELPEAGQFLFIDKLPQDGSIDSVIRQYPGQAAHGVVGATAERIEAAMQFIAGTYTLGGQGGAPDQQAVGTATGVAAVVEQASGRMLAPIKLKIAADKEMLYQILENIRDYSAPEQRAELEKRFGPDVCGEFFSCNFRKAVTPVVAPNTDMPRSMALIQANTMAFANAAAALKDAPYGNEILSQLGDVLGVPLSIGAGRADRREAEYRLHKLAAVEERILERNPQFAADAGMAAQTMLQALEKFCAPLIEPFMHDHDAFMDVYKDWLFGEQAKTASEAIKAVVVELWMRHFKAKIEAAAQLAMLQQQVGQMVNPQPSPEEIATQSNEQRQQEMEGAALAYAASEEAKDSELERDLIRQAHAAEIG